MKKYFKYLSLSVLLLPSIMVSCSDNFLEEKKDYAGFNEQVYQDSAFAQAYVDYVYNLFLPPANSSAMLWNMGPGKTSGDDTYTKATDEFSGQSSFNQPVQLTYTAGAPEYFGGALTSSTTNVSWTRIRQINLFLDNIDNYGLPLYTRNKFKGQLYFWRAWEYFSLVKLYGGVPLILHAQNPITGGDVSDLQTPRSKTSDCIKQIKADLDSAINMLPGKWANAQWGRIHKGAAAAFKGRVLLTYASPQFNRNDEVSRWQEAYDANLAAKTILDANGFGLYTTGGAAAWGNMWFSELNNPEAVITFGFNALTTGSTQKNNGWEYNCRSKTIGGGGSIAPTKEILDAFPMADGKDISSSSYTYDPNKFYKNRDPRFYKTFVYNGAAWSYSDNTSFKQWTYNYYSASNKTTADKTTETLGTNTTGIYVCKSTNPAATRTNIVNKYSGTDCMEMRYAEVLLNLAESAVGIDKRAKTDESFDGLIKVRQRAGIPAGTDGYYGLKADMSRDELFAAIIKERQVEFAFEGKRFWDLRRWMLFDETATGDNTNARLGIPVLNGTRRHGLWIEVKKTAWTKATDPLLTTTSGYLVDRETANIDVLYDTYFTVTTKEVESTTSFTFTWYPNYYFFGINATTLNAAPYLQQTSGWNGPNGAGDFDPLQ